MLAQVLHNFCLGAGAFAKAVIAERSTWHERGREHHLPRKSGCQDGGEDGSVTWVGRACTAVVTWPQGEGVCRAMDGGLNHDGGAGAA